METTRLFKPALTLTLAGSLTLGGCKKQNQQGDSNQPQNPPASDQAAQQPQSPAQAATPNTGATPSSVPNTATAPAPPAQSQAAAPAPEQAAPPPPPVPVNYVVPAGTRIRVSLGQDLSSKTNQAGDTFSATVVSPVVIDGRTVIRSGASATGTVIDAKPLGRFKGGAELAIRLDSIVADGRTYPVATSTIERAEKGKGKRSAGFIGGGGGLGALIGGIAGGGKGALIGGLVGAGAGTAGTAFTGNHQIVIPAETELTFRLDHSVTVR